MSYRAGPPLLGFLLVAALFIGFNALFLLRFNQGLNPTSLWILVFANVNFFLFVLLGFLAFRSYVKLLIDRRNKHFGARLQTRLVLIFTALPLIPTILMLIVTSGIISSTVERWINDQVDTGLRQGLNLATQYYQQLEQQTRQATGWAAVALPTNILDDLDRSDQMLRARMIERDLDYLGVFNPQGEPIVQAGSIPDPRPDLLDREQYPFTYTNRDANQIISIFRIESRDDRPALFLLGIRHIPASISTRVQGLRQAVNDYQQLKLHREPLEGIYYSGLGFFALLILFGSVWSGTYIARRITVPIQELAEATRKIGEGNMNVQVTARAEDEVSVLIDSFNRMAVDLRRYKEMMEKSNRDLLKANILLEERRLFQDIVLQSISTGVISIAPGGQVSYMNPAARAMLGMENDSSRISRDTPNRAFEMLFEAADQLRREGERQLRGEVSVDVNNRSRNLVFECLPLRTDDLQRDFGEVIVIDDLSALVRSQKAMAWRDVARRIAHEIKNPLTPIKLSAERLQRKYARGTDPEQFAPILGDSVSTIIRNVDTMHRLVDEFSQYARLPRARFARIRVEQIARESLDLLRHANPHVQFDVHAEPGLPPVSADPEQLSRVFINLLDNAVAALGESGGSVSLRLERRKTQMDIHILDNGPGIAPEDLERIFEPYYTGREGGTGLGLAIVKRIVEEHSGVISATNLPEGGSHFLIELPLQSSVEES